MKTLRYIALAALTLSFAACEQEDINSAVQCDPDAVKINATIGNMQTRVAYSGDNGVTNFVNGDAIKVVNLMRTSKNEATYTTTDGTNWTTTDAMVWNSSSKNIFQAWYPVADYSSYDTFTIPTDQSDATKLASADWMTASTEEIDKPGNGVLDLSFQHRLAKVTVNLTFSSQYPEGNQYVSDFKFLTNEETPQVITALKNSETSYTAILRPGEYADESSFIYLMMDNFDEHYVLGKTTTSAINLEAGKHYTFTLKVGKDVVSIDDVTVADWNEEEIDGGVAEEVIPNTFDATAMTAEQLNAAVTKALEYGHTELAITLAADADATMFSAITSALAADGIEEGSIDL
ncbi:MAG: fimbrillin family protein, partial [Bacteroidales bacterium]|nr:fimbrillin family protein [Bacteroidales bacterium]